MSDPSFGPDGIPFPPLWLSVLVLLGLAACIGLVVYVVVFVVLQLPAPEPWQWHVTLACGAAAAMFAAWHLLYGRRGC